MVPKNNYRQYYIDFLSPGISSMVIEKYQGQRKAELLRFLKDSMSTGYASLSHYRGFVFENVAHQILCKGGNFTIYGPLGGTEQQSQITLPECKLVITPDLVISPDNIYYRPVSKTNAGFDSWLGKVGFFQMTTAESHSINADAMGNGMTVALNHNCVYDKLYFVIPIERYETWNRQPFTKAAVEKVSKRRKLSHQQEAQKETANLLLGQLQQFVLVINWEKEMQ